MLTRTSQAQKASSGLGAKTEISSKMALKIHKFTFYCIVELHCFNTSGCRGTHGTALTITRSLVIEQNVSDRNERLDLVRIILKSFQILPNNSFWEQFFKWQNFYPARLFKTARSFGKKCIMKVFSCTSEPK